MYRLSRLSYPSRLSCPSRVSCPSRLLSVASLSPFLVLFVTCDLQLFTLCVKYLVVVHSSHRIEHASFVPHGQKVVRHYMAHGRLIQFEKLWRRHFLDTMRPNHLPDMWSVDHHHDQLSQRGDALLAECDVSVPPTHRADVSDAQRPRADVTNARKQLGVRKMLMS